MLSSASQGNDVGLPLLISLPPPTTCDIESKYPSPSLVVMGETVPPKTAIIVGTFCHVQICQLHPKANGALLHEGAGVGGVATAARLAKAGFKVTVFEKNDFSGGRCSLINHDGYVRYVECFVLGSQLTFISALRPRTLTPPPPSPVPRSLL